MVLSRRADADARIESAQRLIKVLLAADDLLPCHRTEFLRIALYKVTEAEWGKDKRKARYISQRALSEAGAQLQHEHVYERAKMVKDLLAHPDRVDDILSKAVACTVTKDEHQQLTRVSKENPHARGWERYRLAGIVVIDRVTELPVDLSEFGETA